MKNKTPLLTLVAMLMLSISTLQAQGPEQPADYRADSLFTSGGMLTVPEGMYRIIETWTLLEEQERTQDLATYLYQNYPHQELVNDFLGLYQSGFSSSANTNKAASTPCVCKTLRPYQKQSYWSEDITPTRGVNWDVKRHSNSSWNGKQNVSFHQYNQGPAVDMRLRVGGDDGAADAAIAKEDGIIVFEFLNLCTSIYEISSECNCDKFLEADAKYMHYYTYYGTAKTVIGKRNHWARLGYGIGAFSFDRTNIGLTTLNTNNLQMNVEIKENIWEFKHNTNFEGTLKIASAIAKLVTNIKDVSGGLTALASAVNTAGAQVSTKTSASPVSNQALVGGTVILKANLPKIIAYTSVVRMAGGGMGSKFTSELNYDSFFWVAFKIPNTNFGTDVNGDRVPEVCCNETYGQWWMSKNFAINAFSYTKEKQKVFNILDASSQAYNLYRWYHPIQLYPNVPQNVPPAVVNPVNRKLVSLDTNYGALESFDYCGCEDLKISNQNISVGLIRPDIHSPNQSYCGTPFMIKDINFNNVDLSKIQVNWYYKTLSSNANTGNPIGAVNNSSVSVAQPGIYSVVYTSLASPNCQSIDYIYIRECAGKQSHSEAAENISIAVYPNPAKEYIIVSDYSNLLQMKSYKIVNATGQIVGKGQLPYIDNKIDVRELPTGLYAIMVLRSNKRTIYS